jgi:hypothetical protein
MGDNYPAEDGATSLQERRWFAAARAAAEIRAECEALERLREFADAAWRDARSRLFRLEALSESLADELP